MAAYKSTERDLLLIALPYFLMDIPITCSPHVRLVIPCTDYTLSMIERIKSWTSVSDYTTTERKWLADVLNWFVTVMPAAYDVLAEDEYNDHKDSMPCKLSSYRKDWQKKAELDLPLYNKLITRLEHD